MNLKKIKPRNQQSKHPYGYLKIEVVIKCLQLKKNGGPDRFTLEFLQSFKENLYQTVLRLIKNKEKKQKGHP